MTKFRNGEQISGCQGFSTVGKEKQVRLWKVNGRKSRADGTALYLDHIDVNIPAVTSQYSFARCYHWGKLGKGYRKALNYFIKLHVNLQLSQNKNFNEKKYNIGNSLAVQWLGLRALTAEGWVQSLVRELRSHKPRGVAK